MARNGKLGKIGVLALQGGYAAHAAVLQRLGHETVEVRAAEDFDGLSGLVLPGGESTTQLNLIERFGLAAPLCALLRSGQPVLATCAGLVLCARRVTGPEQPSFGFLDVEVVRNAWGRQLDSFEAVSDDGARPLVFIRAPRIVAVGPEVRVLGTLRGEPILVQQGNLTGAAFHPELSPDPTLHREVFGP